MRLIGFQTINSFLVTPIIFLPKHTQTRTRSVVKPCRTLQIETPRTETTRFLVLHVGEARLFYITCFYLNVPKHCVLLNVPQQVTMGVSRECPRQSPQMIPVLRNHMKPFGLQVSAINMSPSNPIGITYVSTHSLSTELSRTNRV